MALCTKARVKMTLHFIASISRELTSILTPSSARKAGWQRNVPLRFSKRTARDTGNVHGTLIVEVESKRNMVEKGLLPLEDALDGLFRKERERRARLRSMKS